MDERQASIEAAQRMIAGWKYVALVWSEAKLGPLAEQKAGEVFDRLMSADYKGRGLSVWRAKEPKDPKPGRVTRWRVIAMGDAPVIEQVLAEPLTRGVDRDRLEPAMVESLLVRRLEMMQKAAESGQLRSHTHFDTGAELDRAGRMHPRG